MGTQGLAKAARTGLLADDDPEGLAYLHAWSDRSFLPCLILTPQAGVIWRNQAGRILLTEGDRLLEHNGRLACADKSQAQDLLDFVARAAAEGAIWVYLDVAGGNLVIRGEPVRRRGHAAAGLMIHPIGEAAEASWADLTRVFPLTRAEAAVVRNAAAGARADVIAADLGVSLETVRTHFRRIYAKLGVSSREQLFALVTPYRLP
mgnify:CR=1 FL=1